MYLDKKKSIKCLAKIIAAILASVYLTFIVDVYTLNTTLKRIFVFGYFLIICAIFVYLKERFIKRRSSMSVTVLATVIAAVILTVFQNVFLPTARNNTIILQAGETGEVWLTNLEVDGESIPLSQLNISKNYNWEYSAVNDDFVFYPNENWEENTLIFDIVGNKMTLSFAANTWSGSVNIIESAGELTTLALYSENTEYDRASFLVDASRTYNLRERCIYNVGAMLLLSFLFSLLFHVVTPKFKNSRRYKENIKQKEPDTGKREAALDIVRIVALFYVISIHFFLNCEYYSYPILGNKMFVLTTMRTAFMSCVPLFCVLSGYLTGEKALSMSYYCKIWKILKIYVLACLANILWRHFFFSMEVSFRGCIEGILNFSAAPYGWYVEMYIGLFLLTPFLNILYDNLSSKAHKNALVLTLVFLTALPQIVNIFNFNISGWWLNPAISSDYLQILPAWWNGIWPMTYFFLGRYIKEYCIRAQPVQMLGLYMGSVLTFGVFNYYRSYGHTFVSGPWQEWGSLPNTIMTAFLFVLLVSGFSRIESQKIKKILNKLSDLCFGGYLVSYIFDTAFYPILNKNISNIEDRIYFYPIISVLVFFCSLALSYLLQKISQFSDIIKKYMC